MATFRMTYSTVSPYNYSGAHQVMRGRGAVATEALTTSASSQRVKDATISPTEAWSAPGEGFITMRSDGAVWVVVGNDPQAAANRGYYLAADERFYLSVQTGDKVAVIDG